MPIKQTKKNLIFNAISLIINVFIGFLYTPYLVKTLGIIAYGIIPLTIIINQYIGVITDSLIASMTRFYAVALQQKNYFDASKYLSNSFIAIGSLTLLFLPLVFLGITNINSIFNIPPSLLEQAKLLFGLTIISFVLSLLSSLFNISLYSFNRLDLLNIIHISRTSSKIFLTVTFLEFIAHNITFIGLANFFSELFIFSLSIYYFKKNTSKLVRISFKHFEKVALWSLVSMSVWVLLHQIGDAGLYRIDNILVNKFWGIRHSAILGALTELSYYVRISIAVLSTLFGPLILIAYSKNNHEQVSSIALNNSLHIGLVTSLVVGLLIGFSTPFIGLWLGEEYNPYSNWLVFKLAAIPFFTASGLFHYVYRAWNQIAMPAIATLVLGFVNFIIVYGICSFGHGDEDSILIMLMVITVFAVIQSYWLNAYTVLKIYPHIGRRKLVSIFLKILLSLILTIGIASAINSSIVIKTLLQLGLLTLLSAVIAIPLIYFFILNKEEKDHLGNYFDKLLGSRKRIDEK